MDLARNLIIESVSRLNPAPPLIASPTQTVADAVALMREKHVGCVLICTEDQLVGIFTERDLVIRVMAPGKPLTTPLQECMTAQPTAVRCKEPIGVALRRMQHGGYRHLPVVGEDGKPVGVLSVNRIVNYLVEHFPATIYNLPPNPDDIPRQPEGA